MSSVVVDSLSVLLMIRSWLKTVDQMTVLLQKMREEGRDTLTDEELKSLKSADDAARDELLAAITDVEAEGA